MPGREFRQYRRQGSELDENLRKPFYQPKRGEDYTDGVHGR